MVEFKGIQYLRKFGFFSKSCVGKYNNIIEICIEGMHSGVYNDTVKNEILRTKLYSTSTINSGSKSQQR